jgi:hypothetical protein
VSVVLRPPVGPTVARTVIVSAYLAVLVVAGDPTLSVTLLGLALVAVWAAPLLVLASAPRVVPRPAVAGDDPPAARPPAAPDPLR